MAGCLAVRAGLSRRLLLSSTSRISQQAYLSSKSSSHFQGVDFWPAYFTLAEQKTLLKACLHKLDNSESLQSRRRRRLHLKSKNATSSEPTDVQNVFLPEEYYEFQEGHYDGVIRNYREMHLTSWPVDKFEGLSSILRRLYDLCPSQNIQTHLLHLGTHGCILPHVDNIHASGSWILGVSIGDQRLLRLESVGDNTSFELLLPSGSVYLQSGDVRYTYKHSIIHASEKDRGQRLSIMIRDLPKKAGNP